MFLLINESSFELIYKLPAQLFRNPRHYNDQTFQKEIILMGFPRFQKPPYEYLLKEYLIFLRFFILFYKNLTRIGRARSTLWYLQISPDVEKTR